MRELIKKIPHLEKRYRTCSLVVLVLLVLCFLLPLAPDIKIVSMIVLLFALWFSVAFYWSWRKRRQNYEWFLQVADESILDSFNMDPKAYSPRPNVYFSTKALFDNQPYLILPYSKVVWAYKEVTRYKGGGTVQQAVFCAMDGKKISLTCNDEVFQKLLVQYVIPQSPGVMIGYSDENLKKYKQMRKKL